jgi:hypothetical protein
MCGVIDLSPRGSFIGGGEDAAYTVDLSIGKQREISTARSSLPESNNIGLRHVRQFSKTGAAIGRMP